MPSSSELLIEFHYTDGDVGVHEPTKAEAAAWASFSGLRDASHIVIRKNDVEGQVLSNGLFAAARDFWNSRFPAVLRRKP